MSNRTQTWVNCHRLSLMRRLLVRIAPAAVDLEDLATVQVVVALPEPSVAKVGGMEPNAVRAGAVETVGDSRT